MFICLLFSVYGTWPMWGADPEHSSVQNMKGAMTTAPVVKWSFLTGHYVEWQNSAIVDVDGDGLTEIVFGSCDYKMYCLNGATGAQKWSFPTGNRIYSSPAVADVDGDGSLEVVFGSDDYKFYCLTGSNGALEWSFTTGNYVDSHPTITDLDGDGLPEIVFGSSDDRLYCLNGSGGQKWSFLTGGDVVCAPAVADLDADGDMEVVFGSKDYRVYCVDGATGALEWSFLTGNTVISSPAVADLDGDGVLEAVLGSTDYNVYCVDGATGAQEWLFVTGNVVVSSPAIADADEDGQLEVFIGSYDMNMYCLDGSSGAAEWASPTSGVWLHTAVSLADVDGDDRLEVMVPNVEMGPDTLYCFNAENGTLCWKRAVGWDVHSPFPGDIDGDGCIEVIVGTADYYLYALDDPINATGCGALGAGENGGLNAIEFRPWGRGVSLFLPAEAWVSLSLYDAGGRLIQNLYDGLLAPGTHTFIPKTGIRGVHLAVLRYQGRTRTVKLIR
ncbi:MAG: PQQ-binding-like beta-propeller repeat protein [candidate division WOR-3 bacterium]